MLAFGKRDRGTTTCAWASPSAVRGWVRFPFDGARRGSGVSTLSRLSLSRASRSHPGRGVQIFDALRSPSASTHSRGQKRKLPRGFRQRLQRDQGLALPLECELAFEPQAQQPLGLDVGFESHCTRSPSSVISLSCRCRTVSCSSRLASRVALGELAVSARVCAYVIDPVGVDRPVGSWRPSVRPTSVVTTISAAITVARAFQTT